MKSGPFINLVADALGVERGTTRLVARTLREAGWLTSGPRGVNAPDMQAQDASRLIIAMLTGASPSQALRSFETFRALILSTKERRAELEERLSTDRVDTLDECVSRFIGLMADDHNSAGVRGAGSNIVNFELTVNETSRIATMCIGGRRFGFSDFTLPSNEKHDIGPSGPTPSYSSGPSLKTAQRTTTGIQTTRSLTFTEIDLIAKGLAGRLSNPSTSITTIRAFTKQGSKND